MCETRCRNAVQIAETVRAEETMRNTANKKLREEAYVEIARKLCPFFPRGAIERHERPDFLIQNGPHRLGVEVTELCMEELRNRTAMASTVAGAAFEFYNRRMAAQPVDVAATFIPNLEPQKLKEKGKALAEFVLSKCHERGCFDVYNSKLPEGFFYIAIHPALEGSGEWRIIEVHETILASKRMIENCILRKSRHLPEYKKAAEKNWLIIVNDQFLDHGRVWLTRDLIVSLEFESEFDKVFLLIRAIGGADELIEIKHQ